MIILKVTKKQVFTLSLEDAFFGKTTEGHITEGKFVRFPW